MSKQIKKIVVVGGGSAGWMTAATLISQLPDIKITVIESPDVPTVGVGESTIGGINVWTNVVGIDKKDFIPFTDACYKLSISFTDFYRKGSGTFHYPFGLPDVSGNFAEKNDWVFKKIFDPSTPNSDYAESVFPHMALVTENKLDRNETGKIPGFVFDRDTAFNFDAVKFATWLRDKFSKPKGVKHLQAKVTNVIVNDDGIEYLILDNDEKITADLFIDCTGFKSLLLGEALKEPFNSYEHMLPNNSAWACQVPYTDKETQLVSWTDCHAIGNGWVWTTPLWSRIGTGYVYSDKFISDEGALEEFKDHLKMKGLYNDNLKFKNLKMRVGIHERLWVKNVVAIGMSGGFIEPLESSGLYTVHEFLLKLVRQLGRNEDHYVSQWDKDNLSHQCISQFKAFAEFVALHYAASHRDDTEYWRDIGSRNYAKSLNSDMAIVTDVFTDQSVQRFRKYHYNVGEWSGVHCIMMGMNCFPTDKYSIKGWDWTSGQQEIILKHAVTNLNKKKEYWKSLVKDSPSLIDYLKKHHYPEET